MDQTQTYIVIFQTSKNTLVKTYLKQFKAYTPITKDSWAIRTSKTAADVRSDIAKIIDKGDKVFVVRSGTEAAWISQPQAVTDWLKKYL